MAEGVELIAFSCRRRTEWLCCDIQQYPTAMADDGHAVNDIVSVRPNSVLRLELLLNEATNSRVWWCCAWLFCCWWFFFEF